MSTKGITNPDTNKKDHEIPTSYEDNKSANISCTNSIFQQPWWLEAASPGKWDEIVIKDDEGIVARLPYVKKDKFGLTILSKPQLTPILGPWIKTLDDKPSKCLSQQKEIMTALINKLPDYDYFCQDFHYSITNWLPFYWKGFEQTTLYTYVIEDLRNLEQIFDNFSRAKKKNIKRAEKALKVHFDLSAREFYQNHKITLQKQGLKISYSFNLFERLYHAVYKHKSGKTIYAVDEKNNLHSALFVVWDKDSAYNLISTIDPDFRISGSASLLIREILIYLLGKTRQFDFEGSMIENVETSFRQFGATQKPYFRISRINSCRLKILLTGRDMLKAIVG